MAAWRLVTAQVLLVIADGGFVVPRFGSSGEEFERLTGCFTRFESKMVANAGHNIHHDQPRVLAGIMKAFLER